MACIISSCSSDDNDTIQTNQTNGIHFVATIGPAKSSNITRTTYTESGTTIDVSWRAKEDGVYDGDQIALLHNGVKDVVTVTAVDPITGVATIEGNITGSPADNDDVVLVFPASSVNSTGTGTAFEATTASKVAQMNQDGTLAYIQDNLDSRLGSGKLCVPTSGDASLKTNVTMTSQISIWKLSLTIDDKTTLGASELTMFIGNTSIARVTNTYRSVFYVCVVPATMATLSGDLSVDALNGSTIYSSRKYSGINLETGKYYQSTLIMSRPIRLNSLTSNYNAKSGDRLTGKLASSYKISIADGATVTFSDVDINSDGNFTLIDNSAITCDGDATIILEGTNKLFPYNQKFPALYVPTGKTLVIQGTGSLSAIGKGFAAGIGSGSHSSNSSCGNIVIKGGTIIAFGSNKPGIGGQAGDITIYSGSITANGSDDAAGIGSGSSETCGKITISGGTIIARGNNYAAGIGCGKYGRCSDIEINGGTVTATAGTNSPAAIGLGYGGNCSKITIKNTITSVAMTKQTSPSKLNDFLKATAVFADSRDITSILTNDFADGASSNLEDTQIHLERSGLTLTATKK